LTDIVGFDLTHVYLMLQVIDKRGDAHELPSNPENQAVLRMTLPECHVFLRALREFNGLIEVTTPVLEEARRAKTRPVHSGPAASEQAEPAAEPSLSEIMERLGARIAESEASAEPAERTGTTG
jgi:hypothetical protein